MRNRKRIIWSNMMDGFNADDWRDGYQEYLDSNGIAGDAGDDEQVAEFADETNAFYIDDERQNLDVRTDSDIVAIANIGTWRGRRNGYKIIGDNLKDCLYSDCDQAEWWVDQWGNMRATMVHHDGRNHLLYRLIRAGLSDQQRDNFLDKAYHGELTASDIRRYTTRLGDLVGDVYGWRFSGRRPA